MICLTPSCERLPGRNGYCGTCARKQRKEEQRATRQKLVVKEIRKQSPKMAKALTEYSKKRKQFLTNNTQCGCCDNKATEIHHKKGKSSKELLLDENFWLPVCRTCHRWIEEDPKTAKELGYSLDRLATEPHKI